MSKISSNFAPELSKMTIYTPRNYEPIFEISSPNPTADVVPKEALSIREMLVRTDRGQRLDVHTRMRSENCPDNMYPESEVDQLHESFDDVPPDGMLDRVDVDAYKDELAERRRTLELAERRRTQELVKRKKHQESPSQSKSGDEVKSHGKTNEGDEGRKDD